MAFFAIPLGIKLLGGAFAITGLFKVKSGYNKISGSKEKIAEAKTRHEKNVKKFDEDETSAIKAMDRLGELEISIIASFHEYSDVMEKIYDRPVFEKDKIFNNEIPLFKKEEFKQATVGAKTLLGGIGSAAAGAFASFAASGAITATTAALGTAGTGVAISSLSGAAAANAVFATLGGGTIAAGGGGIALGTSVLGYATFGIGLLIGSYFFENSADKAVKNAEEAFDNMLKAEEKISKCCNYLNVLKEYSERYEKALRKLYKKYQVELEKVKTLVNKQGKVNFLKLTKSEKLLVENLIRIVDVLYKMCNVQFVLKAKSDDEPNNVNSEEIDKRLEKAEKEFPTILADKNIKELTKLPKVLYIISGETKIYRNKIIKFDTTIECAGELTFENCEIWYHCLSDVDEGQIKLIDDAKLVLKNCTVHCEAYSDKPLVCSVPNHGVPSVYINRSEFHDCSEFIAAEYPAYRFKYVIIENSNFYNCTNLMKRVEFEEEGHCWIVNCKFEYTKIADFYIRYGSGQKESIVNEFIHIYSGDFYLENSDVLVSEEVCSTLEKLKGHRFFTGPDSIFYGKFSVKNCNFSGGSWTCLTCVESVQGCVFKECDRPIGSISKIVDNCKFINCFEAIVSFDSIVIKNCIFLGRKNKNTVTNHNSNLLNLQNYDGGVLLIENCTFDNMNIKDDTSLICVHGVKKVSNYLNIKRSVFKNIIVESNATKFINCNLRLPSGIIEPVKFLDVSKKDMKDKQEYIIFDDCRFIDCTGKLVNKDAYWTELNMFCKDDDGIVSVVTIRNCKGIDISGKAT